MKVKLPVDDGEKVNDEEKIEQEDAQDDLPPAEDDDSNGKIEDQPQEAPAKKDETTDLKIQIAKLEGQVDILKGQKKDGGLDSKEENDLRIKQQCLADMNSLDEEAFSQKYRMTKLAASNAISNYDLEKERTKNSTRIAELEAKNDLIAKYPTFSKHFDKIKESVIADLSPEARQDSSRLKRAMEREFLIIQKEEEAANPKKKTQGDDMRKRIVNDFEKPNQDPSRSKKNDENKDELAPELREIGKRFGIESESQRKKFMSPYIPMELGGGYKFEDPKRGFEKKVANT